MADTSPEALWKHWRAHAAERLDWAAEEYEAGGGSNLFGPEQKSIAAQEWRNAATKIRNMPMPPLPQ